ncbi:HalOD1 output domain-containing protein [Halorubrum sp. AD140]|uniref:HalOD1 output domain-containing protein n=1 Tax=Halorubrum sp. AD140 TaxID=3050073 RepID=UPI002ACC3A34|nr:HalOD1 output domain-containing protein [Halorubrum sp. AD140]MDZ5812416.1 HalOD1 output domain-containing protein [Halorubrum sp. AD140]
MRDDVITDIVISIADAEGVAPRDLDLVLSDHIDIDSVGRLVNAEKGSWWLAFDVPGYTVTVWSDGSVLVEPKNAPRRSNAPV